MNETIPVEVITLTEIEHRFDDEWILVEDPEFDANDTLICGRVL